MDSQAPMQDQDLSLELVAQVEAALASRTPLQIVGGGSKAFYGRDLREMQSISLSGHSGIVSYDPAELVVTARAGTPLHALESLLQAHGQMLACEAPDFTGTATVGGMVAAGLSGPRRPWVGSVRDFVLGCRLISGQGKHLRFGGQVIKNVAGYDVSRLMAGSLGCLGLLSEVSLKVLPQPRASLTLRLEAIDHSRALVQLAQWGRQSLPISGACHQDQTLWLRLEGGEGSVAAAREQLGGEAADAGFWDHLRHHRLAFFHSPLPLWRLGVAAHKADLPWPGEILVDWGGAQIWLKSEAPPETIRALAVQAGGHAACYTPGVVESPLMPLAPALLRYHQQLKAQLDPGGIFNPGRMYAEL